MKRTVIAVAAGLAVAASIARAQSGPRTTFVAVDAIRTEQSSSYTWLLVTGLLDGAASTTEERFRFATGVDVAECRRWALVAMAKPGQYKLSISASYVASATPPYWYGYDCQLSRVAP